MFLDLGEVAFCRACVCPSSAFPSHHPGARDQQIQVGSDLCYRVSSAGCRIVVSFLLVSAPLMGEADLGACAGFLAEGLVPAHWWVELGLALWGRTGLGRIQVTAISCWRQSKPEDSGATCLYTEREKCQIRILYMVQMYFEDKGNTKYILNILKQKVPLA